MLALLRNDKRQSILLCDECDGQIKDFTRGKVVILQDALISRVKVMHKRCYRPNRGVGFMNLTDFLIGLLK